MSVFSKPSYKQTLLRLRQDLRANRVLSSFWRKRPAWPDGGKAKIFIGDAVDEVGHVKFGGAWTGKEYEAYRRIDAFPDFSHTLAEFHHEVRESTAQKHSRNPELLRIPATWEGKYRAAYTDAAASWARLSAENTLALRRLDWVINWVVNRARDGELETHLRAVDTTRSPGTYQTAPEGFWDVEDATWNRFREGSVDYELTGAATPSANASSQAFYIFFDRDSLSRAVLTISDPADVSPELTGLYLSPFMRLAIAVIREENLSEMYQSKKESVVATVHRLAPQFGIEVNRQKVLLKYMATMVRDPESKKGRRSKSG